jgi:hypothetical protein
MEKATTIFSFEGCWNTDWTDCNSGDRIAGGAKVSFKKDALNPGKMIGGWTGTSIDAAGNKHCGFLVGQVKGNVLEGNWYEIIYRDSVNCPTLSKCGTFKFTIKGKGIFTGSWTDKNGPCSISNRAFVWNGTR